VNTNNSAIGLWSRDSLDVQFKYLFSFFFGLSVPFFSFFVIVVSDLKLFFNVLRWDFSTACSACISPKKKYFSNHLGGQSICRELTARWPGVCFPSMDGKYSDPFWLFLF